MGKEKLERAPYDDRNEADYEKVTRNISLALEKIEQDRTILATQRVLAELAKCSRSTLRNRGWPLDKLRSIRRQRRQGNSDDSGKSTPKQATDVEIHIEDKKTLLTQLSNCRSEIAVWVNKFKEEETENKKLRRAKEMLEAAKSSLERRVVELTREIEKLKGIPKQRQSNNITYLNKTEQKAINSVSSIRSKKKRS